MIIERYTVYITDAFRKLFSALDGREQRWIDKMKENLEENPTGQPLGYSWFREKRFEGKRLYYLVDENSKRILFVSFATKKDQQNIINFVKENMDELLNYLRSL